MKWNEVRKTYPNKWIVFDSLNQYSEEEEQRKVMGFVYHAERILGMKAGALKEAMRPIFEK